MDALQIKRSMDTADVRIVFKPEQLERFGAFRYQVHIEEQDKSAAHAARNTTSDRADRPLCIQPDLFLERAGRLIATLRVEFLGADDCAHGRAFDASDFMRLADDAFHAIDGRARGAPLADWLAQQRNS
jgi:hypothetical protein